MPITETELDEALAQAAKACADKARSEAERGAPHVNVETYASAAAQLAFAAKGTPTGCRPAPAEADRRCPFGHSSSNSRGRLRSMRQNTPGRPGRGAGGRDVCPTS